MNLRRSILYSLCATLFLVGCGSTPRIEDMSSAQRAKIASIQVMELQPQRPYEVVGTVDGLACKRNAYMETEVSRSEAYDELKIKAAAIGADAVINVVCQKSSSTDWRNNCWASDKCIGDAVRFK
jgi:hypothetical protein